MKGLRPCPYCGGEVEMVKLKGRKTDKEPIFRIECYRCRKLVARGYGFPNETSKEVKERIEQYEKITEQKYAPIIPRFNKHSQGHTWLDEP